MPDPEKTPGVPTQSVISVRATQYAGTMRRKRRQAYGPVAGRGRPRVLASTNGRYSRKPETTKNTATPTSSRAAYGRSTELCDVSRLAKTAACAPRTASAAMARSESNSGKRVARVFIAQYLAGNARTAAGLRADGRADRCRRRRATGARPLDDRPPHRRHRRLVVLSLASRPDRARARLPRPVPAAAGEGCSVRRPPTAVPVAPGRDDEDRPREHARPPPARPRARRGEHRADRADRAPGRGRTRRHRGRCHRGYVLDLRRRRHRPDGGDALRPVDSGCTARRVAPARPAGRAD